MQITTWRLEIDDQNTNKDNNVTIPSSDYSEHGGSELEFVSAYFVDSLDIFNFLSRPFKNVKI